MVRTGPRRLHPETSDSGSNTAAKWRQFVAILDAIRWGISIVIVLRTTLLLVCAIAGIVALRPAKVSAQWWSRTPTDFEECADAAEKGATREARTDALAECNAKFAGRRKPGGGYTYYDFMQDRTFDIAGPNPTQEEQKRIDEQYAIYLEKQRRNSIAAAFAAQQQQQEPVQQNALRTEAEPAERVPLPHQRPTKAQMAAAAAEVRRIKCAKSSFSCDWPNLSETLSDLKKKLFGSQQGQQGQQSQQGKTKRI
jgi:hypothetical protein